jgi:aspartate/glutamate racemase
MPRPLNETTLGIIHASSLTIRAMQPFLERYVPEVAIMHLCDDTIQRDNIKAGPGIIPKVNYLKFAQYAHNLEEAGVDVILLACSTFNFAAELGRPMVNTPIMQIDRTMMEMAVDHGSRVGMLATLATTVPSSERLLRIVAAERRKDVEITTVLRPEAFEAIQKGDAATHNAILLEEIDKLSGKVDSIVMAQLSMSALAPFLKETRVPVYDSGTTTFPRLRQMLSSL